VAETVGEPRWAFARYIGGELKRWGEVRAASLTLE
jgi:hypothetical protein